MSNLTKTRIKLILIGTLLALALSLDYDHLIDRIVGETVEGEAVSFIDYRYEYGRNEVESVA